MSDEQNRLQKETKKLNTIIRKQVGGYILAGLGVVVGLAWNDAIKSLIDALFPPTHGGVQAKFFYAIGLTIIITIVSVYVFRTHDENS